MGRLAGGLVAVLVLVAGCNAVPVQNGPARDSETVTPVPVPERTASGTPESVVTADLPPGISASGRVEPAKLRRAHREALPASNYTWIYRRTDTSTDDGSAVKKVRRRVLVGEAATLVETAGFPFVTNSSLFLTDDSGYLRTTVGDETRYETVAETRRSRDYVPVGRLLEGYLSGVEFEVTVVVRNETRLVRLYAPPGSAPPALVAGQSGPNTVENYTATAYVEPSGLVRRVVVSYDWGTERGQTSQHTVVSFEYRAVGETSVTRPTWVGRFAANGSSAKRSANATTGTTAGPANERDDPGDSPPPGT